MAATRTLPDGTTDITGAALMDKYKEEIEAIIRGPAHKLTTIAGINTITASPVIEIPDYYDGMRFVFKPAANNTAGVTINIGSKGAKAVKTVDGATLQANELVADRATEIMYIEEDDWFVVLTGLSGASVDSASVIVSNQQANNVAGGDATAGSWQTYPLNTVNLNELSGEGAALASNVITLPAGTYDFYASVPFYLTDNSKIRLFNVTDTAVVAAQSCAQTRSDSTTAASEGMSSVILLGRVTITGPKDFRLEYRVQTTNAGDGLGLASNFTEAEQYGVLMFMRPAEGGVDGDAGQDGAAGFTFLFDSTATEADPGNGEFRFNNASIAAVTEIYVDDLETAGGQDVSAVIAAWGTASSSTIKGHLHIQGIDDLGDYADFDLNSVTDETGYTQLNVTYVGHAGTFTAAQRYAILFVPKGDKGDTGATGPTGPNNGWDYQWNTATSGDPGAGKILANHATFASITALHIDDLDRGGVNNEAGIQASDDSTSNPKSLIRVVQVSDRTKFMEFELDSVWADQTGYWTATVTPVQMGTAIDNDAIVSITMYRTGEAGGLQAANNLSDVADPSTAAQNIGALEAANNLSDVANVATSRNNLSAEPQKVRLGSATKTGSYTLALADAGFDIRMNVAGANNLTVPPNSDVAFALDTVITGGQYGAGQTTIVAGAGVTIRSRGGKLKSAGQYARWELMKIATNEWWLAGDLTT